MPGQTSHPPATSHPRREAPAANCTWRLGSDIWGHWCLAVLCPVPLLCVLGSISSLLPINIYSSYMPLQIGLILAYFWDRDAPVQPESWGIGGSTFFFFFRFYWLSSRREREKKEGGNRRREGERGKTNIKNFKCEPNVKEDMSSISGEQTRRVGLAEDGISTTKSGCEESGWVQK